MTQLRSVLFHLFVFFFLSLSFLPDTGFAQTTYSYEYEYFYTDDGVLEARFATLLINGEPQLHRVYATVYHTAPDDLRGQMLYYASVDLRDDTNMRLNWLNEYWYNDDLSRRKALYYYSFGADNRPRNLRESNYDPGSGRVYRYEYFNNLQFSRNAVNFFNLPAVESKDFRSGTEYRYTDEGYLSEYIYYRRLTDPEPWEGDPQPIPYAIYTYDTYPESPSFRRYIKIEYFDDSHDTGELHDRLTWGYQYLYSNEGRISQRVTYRKFYNSQPWDHWREPVVYSIQTYDTYPESSTLGKTMQLEYFNDSVDVSNGPPEDIYQNLNYGYQYRYHDINGAKQEEIYYRKVFDAMPWNHTYRDPVVSRITRYDTYEDSSSFRKAMSVEYFDDENQTQFENELYHHLTRGYQYRYDDITGDLKEKFGYSRAVPPSWPGGQYWEPVFTSRYIYDTYPESSSNGKLIRIEYYQDSDERSTINPNDFAMLYGGFFRYGYEYRYDHNSARSQLIYFRNFRDWDPRFNPHTYPEPNPYAVYQYDTYEGSSSYGKLMRVKYYDDSLVPPADNREANFRYGYDYLYSGEGHLYELIRYNRFIQEYPWDPHFQPVMNMRYRYDANENSVTFRRLLAYGYYNDLSDIPSFLYGYLYQYDASGNYTGSQRFEDESLWPY